MKKVVAQLVLEVTYEVPDHVPDTAPRELLLKTADHMANRGMFSSDEMEVEQWSTQINLRREPK